MPPLPLTAPEPDTPATPPDPAEDPPEPPVPGAAGGSGCGFNTQAVMQPLTASKAQANRVWGRGTIGFVNSTRRSIDPRRAG